MKRIFVAMLLLLLLQPAALHAQSFTNLICSSLYSTASNGLGSAAAISQSSTYTGMMSFSLLIVLMVLVVLGIIYAIGYSMRIDRLKSYTKTELLESIFNVVIIVAIVGGMGLVDSGISMITGIAGAAISGAQGATNVQISPLGQVSNAHDLYVGICTNYAGSLLSLVGGVLNIYALELVDGFATGFTLEIMPNQGGFIMLTPGFILTPFAGLTVSVQVLAYIFTILAGLGILFVGIPVLLFFIYYLFPFFLYAGVLFRSFPWTRAAGGTLLALFISFYIIFPSIVYPLSAISIGNLVPAVTSTSFGSGGLTSSALSGSANLIDLGALVEWLVGSMSGVVLQIGGLVIALIISYDLVEMFGKLLGAPSVSAKKLLGKVV